MPKTSWLGKIPSNALSIACAGLFFLFVSALHAEEIQSDLILSQHLDIRVDTGRVFMDVRDVEITEVLKALARKANFDVVVTEGIAGRVTLRIDGETLENTLRKLCQNRAVVFEYVPETKTYRIIKAGAYAEGAGDRSDNLARSNTAAANLLSKSPVGDKGGPNKERTPDMSRSKQTQHQVPVPERQYDSKGRPLYKAGEILVKFKEGIPAEQVSAIHQSIGSSVIGRIDRVNLQRLKLKEGLSIKEAVSLYTASDMVENAEVHALRYPNKTPDDPNFPNQWGLGRIRAPEVWDIVQGNPDLIIAVIDTGVDYLHPDLVNNIRINPAELNGSAGVDDDGNGYMDDILGWDFAGGNKDDPNDSDNDPMDTDTGGHGTHVAGIIAAETNNGRGVAGINWNTKIMALKVKADNTKYIEDFDVIQAIDYAINMGARIVNCSFGGEAASVNEENAFADLENAGILAVCAAGNGDDAGNGIDTDGFRKNYPSSYPFENIISVAAGDSDDRLAGFSNYGITSVDLMAPGVNIESTVSVSSYTQADPPVAPPAYYASKQGTSMAAPHVAGVAGLLLSLDSTLTATEIKSTVLNTVDKIDKVSDKLVSGGRINALRAICSSIGAVPFDLSCDTEIDLADAIIALQVLSGMNPQLCSPCIFSGIESIQDGKIGLPHAIYILRKISNLR
jgi:subtilisin family serine protease